MKIELNLLDNGLDYIIEGVKLTTPLGYNNFALGYSNIDSIWKYSVLNIFSGIELILKEKLRREHWSLIFDDVSNATEQKLIQGDFVSVNHNDVIKRLKGICNITVNDEPINTLRKLRNKFEHFEVKITVPECKQIISAAIREIIVFWNVHILPICNEEQNNKFNQIKCMVFEFDAYVENMLQIHNKKIENIVSNKAGILVHCRSCGHHSFIIYRDEKKEYQCFVCEEKIVKQNYLKSIREYELKRQETSIRTGRLSFLKDVSYEKQCQNCTNETRIMYSPGISGTGEYQSNYFFCIDCLHYETESEIRMLKLEQELAELEKNHTPEEFIEILKKLRK